MGVTTRLRADLWAVVYVAAQHGHVEVIQTLHEFKADLNLSTHLGLSPLHIASRIGDARMVKTLIEAGVDLDCCSVHGATPAYLASSSGNGEVNSHDCSLTASLNDV